MAASTSDTVPVTITEPENLSNKAKLHAGCLDGNVRHDDGCFRRAHRQYADSRFGVFHSRVQPQFFIKNVVGILQ